MLPWLLISITIFVPLYYACINQLDPSDYVFYSNTS
jgi:ABC-type multidrug transport system permease subunit